MTIESCFHCGGDISDTVSMDGNIPFHSQCLEKHRIEMEASAEAERLAAIKEQKTNDRILKHLERTLKPKIWVCVKSELESHRFGYLEIVTIDKVKGTKQDASKYFGASVAMRHFYDDVSSCSYSDTYGGDLYLYLGKKRYLKMTVWG